MHRSALHLLALVVAVTASASTEESNRVALAPNKNEDGRGLQLADTICPIIEDTIFQGLATCDCGVTLLAGKFDVACTSDPICSPANIVCGSVGFSTNFTLFPPTLDASLCIANITLSILNIDLASLGPFCINYATAQARNTCRNGIPKCVRSGKILTAARNSNVKSCTVRIGNKECSSCTPCDNNGGVTFDCTNIVKRLKVTKCASFNPWLGVGSKAKAALPDLVLAK